MNSFARTHAAALLVAVLATAAAARAQSGGWRDAGGNAQYRVLQHQRVQGMARTGGDCEWLQVEAAGPQVYFAHDVGRPRIIDELAASLWIKADKPGPYLAVRVVLPRTVDPRSGRPLATILMGAAYNDVGRWQQLQIGGISALLARQIRVLRLQLGPQVDGREAYLDAVLLNVSAGPGVTNVWIDRVEIAGYAATGNLPSPFGRGAGGEGGVTSSPDALALTLSQREREVPLVPVRLPSVQQQPGGPELNLRPVVAAPAAATGGPMLESNPAPRRTAKLVGSVLLVDGRPMFPRAIQHCGEPLSVLKKLGFNTVWLRSPPPPELLGEADRLGLWLICPPPQTPAPITTISPAFDSVLAWDLGTDLTEAELDAAQRWAEQVRAADRRMGRPLVCCPRTDLRAYSRLDALLLIDRRPLGTSLQMSGYAAWVRRQPLLARPGTSVWTTVQTQPNLALRQQLAALEPGVPPPLGVSPEQIRLLAYTAVAAGSRGLLLLSDTPLDASDPDTQQRATALELLNLELELIEPWAAAGSLIATADCTTPEVVGAVLNTEHARLLLPIWSAPMAQCVPPQSAANSVTFVVPGMPEATEARELTPGGVKKLRRKRVAGGLSVTLDEFDLTTQVLLAQDPSIIGAVDRRAAEMGRRAAELERQLAVRKLNTVEALAGQLVARSRVAGAAKWLEAARKDMKACDSDLGAGHASEAVQNAHRATRALRLVERGYWDATAKGLASPVTSPAAVAFDTLPFHWRLVDRLAGCRFGPNRIAGGDFENVETMMRAGWRYTQHGSPSVQPAVDLMPEAARSGRLGLRLTAKAVDPKFAPAVVETPPVLFTSPPVQVEAGQIVCVYGWVQVPGPIAGSDDGLLIVDSLGGEALADRIGQTKGWQQFALYRVAPQSGTMWVTFALSGLGEARLDDVAIQVVEAERAMNVQR